MNIFNALVAKEHANDFVVGVGDRITRDRRFAALAEMTGGRGFGTPPKQPRRDSQGLTRGDRKRLARLRANAAVSEQRQPQFMHSAARRRLELAHAS